MEENENQQQPKNKNSFKASIETHQMTTRLKTSSTQTPLTHHQQIDLNYVPTNVTVTIDDDEGPNRKMMKGSQMEHSLTLEHSNDVEQLNNLQIKPNATISKLPPEIMSKILAQLSPADLLSTRLVQKGSWLSLSTNHLQNQKHFKLYLRFHQKSQQFVKAVSYPTRMHIGKHLNALTHLLNNSTTFPTFNYDFEDDGFYTPSTLQFFCQHGPKIRSLDISLYNINESEQVQKTDLKKMFNLISKAVNLTSLKIFCPNYWEADAQQDHFEFDPPLNFTKLETLDIQNGNSIGQRFIEILEGAPNLKTFCGFRIDLFKALEAANKIGTIKDLLVDPNSSNIDLFEQLSNSPGQKMESIRLSDNMASPRLWESGQAGSILLKLLNANSCTLKMLCLTSETLGPLNNNNQKIIWPILPTLTKVDLHVYKYSENAGSLFPPGFQFAINFPNIKNISVGTCQDSKWEMIFSCVQLPVQNSVNLHFTYFRNCKLLELFGKLFPNVKRLNMNKFRSMEGFPREIWTHFPSVERIQLAMHVRHDFHTGVNKGSALDSHFTGFSERNCSIYRQFPEILPGTNYTTGEITREFPSIVRLQKLKIMDIELSGSLNVIPHPARRPFISHVSRRFAFELMPNFERVNISIDTYSAKEKETVRAHLASVGHYVNLTFR